MRAVLLSPCIFVRLPLQDKPTTLDSGSKDGDDQTGLDALCKPTAEDPEYLRCSILPYRII